MSNKVVYERDLLYPTDADSEPGVLHLEVLGMDKGGRVQVIIENKSKHSPVNYIDSIVDIMQKDVFDRLDVDVRKNVDINIKTDEETKKSYDNKNYIRVYFKNGEMCSCGVDEVSV